MNFDVPRIQNKDPESQRFFDSLLGVLSNLNGIEILKGQIVEDIDLVSGDTTINHGLGRRLLGWIIIRRSAASTVYDKQAANSNPDKTLVLNSSAALTVSLWVF